MIILGLLHLIGTKEARVFKVCSKMMALKGEEWYFPLNLYKLVLCHGGLSFKDIYHRHYEDIHTKETSGTYLERTYNFILQCLNKFCADASVNNFILSFACKMESLFSEHSDEIAVQEASIDSYIAESIGAAHVRYFEVFFDIMFLKFVEVTRARGIYEKEQIAAFNRIPSLLVVGSYYDKNDPDVPRYVFPLDIDHGSIEVWSTIERVYDSVLKTKRGQTCYVNYNVVEEFEVLLFTILHTCKDAAHIVSEHAASVKERLERRLSCLRLKNAVDNRNWQAKTPARQFNIGSKIACIYEQENNDIHAYLGFLFWSLGYFEYVESLTATSIEIIDLLEMNQLRSINFHNCVPEQRTPIDDVAKQIEIYKIK